jgi:uncharacterized protein with PIN domain
MHCNIRFAPKVFVHALNPNELLIDLVKRFYRHKNMGSSKTRRERCERCEKDLQITETKVITENNKKMSNVGFY